MIKSGSDRQKGGGGDIQKSKLTKTHLTKQQKLQKSKVQMKYEWIFKKLSICTLKNRLGLSSESNLDKAGQL